MICTHWIQNYDTYNDWKLHAEIIYKITVYFQQILSRIIGEHCAWKTLSICNVNDYSDSVKHFCFIEWKKNVVSDLSFSIIYFNLFHPHISEHIFGIKLLLDITFDQSTDNSATLDSSTYYNDVYYVSVIADTGRRSGRP